MWSCDTIKNCRYFCLDFPLGPKYPFSVALILRLQLGLLSIKPDPLLGWVKARMSHARSRDEREEHSWIRTETHIRRMLCLVPLLQLKGRGNTDKTCGSFQKSASAYCGLEPQVMLPLARSSWSQIYLYVRNATKKETEITETFTVPHPSLLIQQDKPCTNIPHSPQVLPLWSSGVSSGHCSLSRTDTQRYRACPRTPEPPHVCRRQTDGRI